MHVCTVARGHTFATTSGSPLSPSQTRKNTSLTPRLRMSVSTAIGKLRAFTTGPGPEFQNLLLTFKTHSNCCTPRLYATPVAMRRNTYAVEAYKSASRSGEVFSQPLMPAGRLSRLHLASVDTPIQGPARARADFLATLCSAAMDSPFPMNKS